MSAAEALAVAVQCERARRRLARLLAARAA